MTVIEKIKSQYDEFSKVQKKIADFLINNPDKACFYSLKELSEAVQITEVTLIKFTKKIGFGSFVELKKALQYYIQRKLSPNEKLLTAVKDLKTEDANFHLKEIIDVEFESLNRTLEALSVEDIERSVSILKNATRVYLAGEIVSKTIIKYLLTRIRVLGLDVVEFDTSSYTDISTQLINLDPNDVFIICSFPKYSKRTVRLSNYLKDQGIKVIAFTDRVTSPVAENSYIVFPCATDSLVFYNSMTAPIALANILVSSLAFRLKDQLVVKAQKAEAIDKYLRKK